MNFIDSIKTGIKAFGMARSSNSWTSIWQNSKYTHEPDFLELKYDTNVGQYADVTGLTDNKISPADIADMVEKDTIYSGLYDQILETLFKREFYIEVAKDDDGNLLGDVNKAKEFEEKLYSIDYYTLVERQMDGERGQGGGNALIYTVKDRNDVKFKVQPFLEDGRAQVKVYGNTKSKTIGKYEVIDNMGNPVYVIDKDSYFLHARYRRGGDFRFSAGPAKRAVYWYIFKKYLAGANVRIFKKGMQDNTIFTPDYSAIADFIKAMKETGYNQVSGSSSPDYYQDPFKFIAKQSVLDNEILRDQVGDARHSNELLKMKMPYKFEKVGRNNRDMMTRELVKLCDEQIGLALRTPESLINAQKSKYSNAEIERDNWAELVVEPFKAKIEKITESFYLPALDPDYDDNIYKVRFGRDPDEESIKVYEAKTARNKSRAEIIVMLQNTPEYTYNTETDEIEKVGLSSNDDTGELDNDEIVEGNDQEKRSARFEKKKTPAEEAIASSNGKRFVSIVNNAKQAQLDKYLDNVSKRKTIQEAINNMGEDLPSISTMGLNVAVFKQQLMKFADIGVKLTEKDEGAKIRALPDEIIRLMDTKAQLMIKGWDSLTNDQQTLIVQFYGLDYQNYLGLDIQSSNTINNKLTNGLKKQQQVQKEINEAETFGKEIDKEPVTLESIIEEIKKQGAIIYGNQARTIAETEIAQAIEATQMDLHLSLGWTKKRWVTVNDGKVRQSHRDNEAQGWIPINQLFSNGANSPASEINCRCTLEYGK